MARQPEVMLVAGKNGAGKTTLVRKLVSSFDARAVLVVSPSGEWGQWSADVQALVTRALASGVRVLVLDDCDAYLTANVGGFWNRLLSTNRHLGVDVVLVSRRPQELPRWAIAAASRVYLMKLGPREHAWSTRMFGVEPPREIHTVKAITL